MSVPAIEPDLAESGVSSVFDRYPAHVRGMLLRVRTLIFEAGAAQEGVGRIDETLKWGQPAYLTPQTGSGSTVRIDAVRDDPDGFAVYFHCQTDLVETFRRLYPDRFSFEGNRALRFNANDALPEDELRHCIGLTLTYHQRRRAARDKA